MTIKITSSKKRTQYHLSKRRIAHKKWAQPTFFQVAFCRFVLLVTLPLNALDWKYWQTGMKVVPFHHSTTTLQIWNSFQPGVFNFLPLVMFLFLKHAGRGEANTAANDSLRQLWAAASVAKAA